MTYSDPQIDKDVKIFLFFLAIVGIGIGSLIIMILI